MLVLIGISATSAQQGKYTLSGKVTRNGSNTPIPQAEIHLLNTPFAAQTDTNGFFKITDLKSGTYKLTVFALGYKSKTRSIRLDSADLRVHFKMDSLSQELEMVVINPHPSPNGFGIHRLDPVEGTEIYASKKNEVIKMEDLNADLSANSGRQTFSKVAGANIWESEAAGLQLDVGTRGLSPKRAANFNTRQNGYDISADALGYPEAYYIPPFEALQQIEIVRGAASLQYGPHFGGLLNFRLKKGPPNKPIQVRTKETYNSLGYLNTFNSVGGTIGDVNYYTYYQYKTGNGWRPNSQFDAHKGHASVRYQPNEKLTATLEYSLMRSLAQQPGGLTDAMFQRDPQQSVRERNWFRLNWNVAALTLDYKISPRVKLNSRSFGLLGERDALGYLEGVHRGDPMQERTLLKDDYKNFGNETRLLYQYPFLDHTSSLAVGVRYYQGFTNRQQGMGTTGKGPDFSYINPEQLEHSEYDFPSRNGAFFAENVFTITPRLSVTPGFRIEYISTKSDGFYNRIVRDRAGNIIFRQQLEEQRTRKRAFALFGAGGSYDLTSRIELYGNFSENYRGISFYDMRIQNPNLRVDPELKDETGYNADIGIRGNIPHLLTFDASLFYLRYNNRIGSVLKVDSNYYNYYQYRTNVADSRHYGVEAFIETDLFDLFNHSEKENNQLSLFLNSSFLQAHYINGPSPIKGNQVEYSPTFTLRSGLTYQRNSFSTTLQGSYVSRQFTDATNTDQVASGIMGEIPPYYVVDLSVNYTYKILELSGGINNLTNHTFFTRRATGYPGPGIIPANGRNIYLSLGLTLP